MNRRGFLGAILAGCTAPAICQSTSLMRVVYRGGILVPEYIEIRTFSSKDLRLSLEEFSEKIIAPAWAQSWAKAIDTLPNSGLLKIRKVTTLSGGPYA